MKKAFLLSLFLLLPLVSFSQQSADFLVKVTENGLLKKQEVGYDSNTNTLTIGDYLIPVNKNTLVKLKKAKKAAEVEFNLQKGTAIRKKSDENFKNAWYAVEFTSKKSANEFIKAFRKMAN